jgi:hypothetical protein
MRANSNPQSDFVFPSGRELQRRVRLGGNPSHVRGRFFPMPAYSRRGFESLHKILCRNETYTRRLNA